MLNHHPPSEETKSKNHKHSKGSPCLRPLPTLNSFVELPLIKTNTSVVRKQSDIHPLHII